MGQMILWGWIFGKFSSAWSGTRTGKLWIYPLWKYSKLVCMWPLGTLVSSEHSGAEGTAALNDLREFFQPQLFCDSVILPYCCGQEGLLQPKALLAGLALWSVWRGDSGDHLGWGTAVSIWAERQW